LRLPNPLLDMNIIAVNRYYWPDHSASAQMLTDLARLLALQGHRVIVVTSRLRYDGGDLLSRAEAADGVRIRRVATTRFGRAGLLGRIMDYCTFYLSATWAVAQLAGRGDVVIAKTDPPLLSVPIALLRPFKQFTLVNWCQDLFPEAAAALGMGWAKGWMGAVVRSMRNWALRQAALNAVLNSQMERAVRSMGVPASRVRVLENWADADIKPVAHDANPLRKEWGLGDSFVIGYSGNLGRAHLPQQIADLLLRTKDLEGLAWLFIGGGAGLRTVQAAAQGAANVQFKPYQPRERLSLSLSAADAHLISLDPACEGYVAPSKLYGAVAAARPIIFLGASTGCIASSSVCVLKHDSPHEWAAQIKLLQASPRGQNQQAGPHTSHALECWMRAIDALDLNAGTDRITRIGGHAGQGSLS
jgi:colanic acid biosynthesis glycosyl transferase WcaI